MVAYPVPHRLKLKLTPAFAVAVGVSVALACMVMPSDVLEVLMLDSGIPALFPAAEPPLGWTARTAMAMIAGGGAAAAAWLGAFLLLGGEGAVTIAPRLPSLPKLFPRAALSDEADAAPVPVLRRADAHPDAPARAPLRAMRDLGVPFLDITAPKAPPVERDLPRDLNAPLSAFDPDSIPDAPADPVRAVPSLRWSAIHEAGERFETFELPTRVAAPLDEPPIAAPRTDATIHALLDRLERGVGARARSAQPPSGAIDQALNELRRLATR